MRKHVKFIFQLCCIVSVAAASEEEGISNISIKINAGSGQFSQSECITTDAVDKVEEINKTLINMRADFNESNKKLLQEMKFLQHMVSTLMTKVSNLSNHQNSNAANLISIPDKNNELLSNFKFNKSNAVFYFSKSAATWYDADNLCKQHGLQLISVQNNTKLQDLWKFASAYTRSNIWTSGTDQGKEPGDFHWLSGKSVQQDFFHNNQPDDFGFGTDACLAILERLLYDFPCNERLFYVCEEPKR